MRDTSSIPLALSGQRSWGNLRAVVLLTLAGLVLRVARLGFQPLWWDEGYSVWFATHSLSEMAALTARDIHPPLYYALLHLWIVLWGPGPLVLRAMSVLIGALTIPIVYLVGRELAGPRVGLWAATLLAFNPLHIYYSQEVRMYGLVALWGIGATCYAARILGVTRVGETSSARSTWISYALLALAALYTQYYAALLPIGFTVYALWRWRRHPRPLIRWIGLQAIVTLGYLPWVLYAAPELIPYISQKVLVEADRPLGPLVYLARHLSVFAIGHVEGALRVLWPTGLLPLLPIAWWLWRRRGQMPGSQAVPLLLSTLATSLTFGFLLNLHYPFFPDRGERLLLLTAPLLWLMAAIALDDLWRERRWVAMAGGAGWAALAALSLATFYLVPRYPADDYRPLIEQVRQQGQPDDVVWCVFPWQVGYFRAYARPGDPLARLLPSEAWDEDVRAALDETLFLGRRIWLPEHLSLGGVLETHIESYLLGRADVYPTANVWYGPNTRLTLFTPAASPGIAGPQGNAPAEFGRVLRLHRSVVAPNIPRDPTRPELAQDPLRLQPEYDVIRVDLEWEVIGQVPKGLQVGLRLADEFGRTWSQRDSQPIGGSQPFELAQPGQRIWDRHGLMVPAGTPPGRYTVWLKVYTPEGGQALDLIGPDGRTQGIELALGQVDVWPPDRPLDPRHLPIAIRRAIDLDGGIRFLGYTLGQGPFEPGRTIPVNLFWQAQRDVDQEYLAFVQLLDDQQRLLAAWEGPPAHAFPTYEWQRGTLIRQPVELRLPATVPDGSHRLIAGMFRLSDRSRLSLARPRLSLRQASDHLVLGKALVRGRSHEYARPSPQHLLDVQVGSFARLIGYDLEAGHATPGGQIVLTLYWQAIGSADAEYTVFVHLLDAAGRFRGQMDAPPGNGMYPTTGWLVGEYLVDRHVLTLAADATPGPHLLEVGMYLPATNARLPIRDATGEPLGDRIVLSDTPVMVR
ncbi:MAG: glycosyltransferase family 39 protein [Anaerolineae bacterium]|nr:glycosyltransferase family 39 protein [Anaerolineae bacterium]MDW8099870.1 glycosyltransferase family 39 protein [Anaerolineae bacterium]